MRSAEVASASSDGGLAPEHVDAASEGDASARGSTFGGVIDAGTGGGCRLVYGPSEQAFRGPAAIVLTKREVLLVANDGGKPRTFGVPLTPPQGAGAAPVKPSRPTSFVAMHWPACAIAGTFAYCSKAGGVVTRTTLGKDDTAVVAHHRPGTRVAAAAIDGGHAVLATLDTRRTTEGETLQAFVTLDDLETQRLSDEGAGATSVELATRGREVVAAYLDARMAMSPLHARVLSVRDHALSVGEDTVLFVGGAPERSTRFALAEPQGALFALMPHAREATEFGMASIPIGSPPKQDVQAVWSLYPNGLDPAPLAATRQSGAPGEGTEAWVVRVRPEARDVGARRLLELGTLSSGGVFTSKAILGPADHATELAVAVDTYGAVWILYGDNDATFLERRVCR